MIRILFLLVGVFGFLSGSAQLLDGMEENINRGDTLRGALRPERTCYDVVMYDLNIELHPENQSISGYNDIHFIAKMPFQVLQIDLFDNMEIDSIVWNNQTLSYKRDYNAVFVDFGKLIKLGFIDYFRVYYHGQPIIAKNAPWDGGFTWTRDERDNLWVGVSCEGIGASLWWPNKDHLSDEPEAVKVTCAVPNDLMFVGNGTLQNVEEMDGKTAYTWVTNYPINNYNVTLNIGKYQNFQDYYYNEEGDSLLLDYWVMPYNYEKALVHFEQVKPMLACYEEYFGKFPFWEDGYKLVETPYLGMEHQTAIAYGNDYRKGYFGNDYSRIGLDFDYIIIHETGHEYWGNLISCADMADLWIHEGFCTYSEALYVECMFDYETAQDYVNAKKPMVGNKYPMIGVYDLNIEGDGDMYNKGMLFLNTVRHIINDDEKWFAMLKDMTTREFAFQQIHTDDIIQFFNERTDMKFQLIFDQYLNYPNIPALYYNMKKVKGKNYEFTYKWQTDVSDFEMPVVITVGEQEFRLNGTNELQSFEFVKKKKEKFDIDDRHFYIKTKNI